jgi:hypothetical protein
MTTYPYHLEHQCFVCVRNTAHYRQTLKRWDQQSPERITATINMKKTFPFKLTWKMHEGWGFLLKKDGVEMFLASYGMSKFSN